MSEAKTFKAEYTVTINDGKGFVTLQGGKEYDNKYFKAYELEVKKLKG